MKASRRIQTASHWSVYEVEVDIAGAILDVHPFKDDPAPTPLMRGLPDLVRSPLRIDQPYVRAGYLRQREDSRHTRGDEEAGRTELLGGWRLASGACSEGFSNLVKTMCLIMFRSSPYSYKSILFNKIS